MSEPRTRLFDFPTHVNLPTPREITLSDDTFDYFGRLDQKTMEAQKTADKAATAAGKYFSMKEGSFFRLRFYARGGGLAFHPAKTHWIADPVDGKKMQVVCRQLVGEPCPICDLVQELYASGDANNAALAKNMEANFGYLANCESFDEPGVVKVVTVKSTLYKALIGSDDKTRASSIKATVGDFMDPDNGFWIDVQKYEASPWYTARPAFDPNTSAIMKRPAPAGLGPKLHELAKETLVPAFATVQAYVNSIRNGTAFVRPGQVQGGRALPPRMTNTSGAPHNPALAAPNAAQQRVPGPSVQSRVESVVGDDMFGPPLK